MAIVSVALLVAACAPPGGTTGTAPVASPATTTGVTGTVDASPTCPVERAGQSPCVRAVAGAVIVALDSNGAEAGRATSDASGAYFLALPPGSYTLVPQAVEVLMGTAPERPIVVPAGAPLRVDISYDTGIR